jgi:hypothetical protein
MHRNSKVAALTHEMDQVNQKGFVVQGNRIGVELLEYSASICGDDTVQSSRFNVQQTSFALNPEP